MFPFKRANIDCAGMITIIMKKKSKPVPMNASPRLFAIDFICTYSTTIAEKSAG